MTSTTYGYVRVSSKDQNPARQLEAMRSFGVLDRNVFVDEASGKDFERPAWKRLVRRLAAGDVLVVKSIDRLGRCYDEILGEWRRLTHEVGVAIVVLDMPLLDTRAERNGVTGELIADIVLQLLSYVAQVERENIKTRQAEGIAAAKRRGVKFGRPCVPRPENYMTLRAAYLRGELSRKEAARLSGVCVSTFARWLRSDGLCRPAG